MSDRKEFEDWFFSQSNSMSMSDIDVAWDAWQVSAQRPAKVAVQGEPIGEVGTMPGTSGFTMACFRADEVPVGTKIYTTPQPAQATQAEVTDAAIDAATRHLYHNGKPTSKEYRVSIARAILALHPPTAPNLSCKSVQARLADQWGYVRPAAVPMTDEQVRKLFSEKQWYELGEYPFTWVAAQVIIRAAEAHHGITAQGKKETP